MVPLDTRRRLAGSGLVADEHGGTARKAKEGAAVPDQRLHVRASGRLDSLLTPCELRPVRSERKRQEEA